MFCLIIVMAFLTSACVSLDRKAKIYYNDVEISLSDVTDMRYKFQEDK